MSPNTEERLFSVFLWMWALGLGTFAAGGLLFDSWTVMAVGGIAVLAALIPLGVLANRGRMGPP